ncbi:MAG TPA: TetR/AcrR family transcriptional regulator [Mycobacteriales bacterium]
MPEPSVVLRAVLYSTVTSTPPATSTQHRRRAADDDHTTVHPPCDGPVVLLARPVEDAPVDPRLAGRDMSPRRSDPNVRQVLVDVAARLLATEGPQALTARRVAAGAGSSTMAIYTRFGRMNGLVRAIVHEGFARLQGYLTRVEQTTDPVADLALLARAYRYNAVANPHLYTVMFGGSSLGGFSLTEEDRQHGRYTLHNVVDCVIRCAGVGRLRPEDAELVAHQMWSAIHGLVTLELGGYLIDPYSADRLFEAQLTSLMIGAGDEPATAARSVASSRRRLSGEVTVCRVARQPGAVRHGP